MIIYCDLESILILSTDNIDFAPNTKKYQDHIVCSYGYKLVCLDDQYSKPHKAYFGEYTIGKCLNDMIKECEYCSKIIETEFYKPIVKTTKIVEDFENTTKCWIWIYEKEYEKDEVKVKYDDHIYGKYRGSAH